MALGLLPNATQSLPWSLGCSPGPRQGHRARWLTHACPHLDGLSVSPGAFAPGGPWLRQHGADASKEAIRPSCSPFHALATPAQSTGTDAQQVLASLDSSIAGLAEYQAGG